MKLIDVIITKQSAMAARKHQIKRRQWNWICKICVWEK